LQVSDSTKKPVSLVRKVQLVVLPAAASVAEGCTQVATDEDPLLDAIVRAREVALRGRKCV
jgi:hypothetical protein